MEAMRKAGLAKDIKEIKEELRQIRAIIDDTHLTPAERRQIAQARKEMSEGKYVTLEQFERDMGWR
jgi:hypothetical protein